MGLVEGGRQSLSLLLCIVVVVGVVLLLLGWDEVASVLEMVLGTSKDEAFGVVGV